MGGEPVIHEPRSVVGPGLVTAPRPMAIALIALSSSLLVTGCSPKSEESTAAYQAACHGAPLRDIELRNKAMEDGYYINPRYHCIDKASFIEVNEQRARWQAANTPEAIARRNAELAEEHARNRERWARDATAQRSTPLPPPAVVLRNVDVNVATEAEIAGVISVGPDVAAQIIVERGVRRFDGWPDLVGRVVGLSAAQTAVYASTSGLTVNGRSLEGAPPDAAAAAAIAMRLPQRPGK
jgi:hypothetical protein